MPDGSGAAKRATKKPAKKAKRKFNKNKLAKPAYRGRPRTAPAPQLSLCNGVNGKRNRATLGRRRDLLERGRALQYLAVASGAGSEAGVKSRRRHPARNLPRSPSRTGSPWAMKA